MNRIIEDLLDLSRIEGEGSPSREPISVSLIVAESIERIRTAAEQHDVKITFDEPETNQVVFGDRRQLTSALHALLENAVVYSPRDGTVDDPIHRIDAAVDDDGEIAGALRAHRDSRPRRRHSREGPGAHLRALLPGRSGSSSRDRRHGSRAQHCAPRRTEPRRHRARRLSRGRRFHLHPRAAAESSMTKRPSSEPRIKVLVVEDEESFVDALTVGLEREGFEVTTAADGQQGLALFNEGDFDVVLLDLMLPKKSGPRRVPRHSRSRATCPSSS